MIDLETLGTEADCPVIAIGAVFFDADGVRDEFYEVLNVEEQIDAGRKASGSTIKWWMGQSDAAKKVFKDGARDTHDGISRFLEFCKRYPVKELKPWGNGSNFDITIIEHLIKDCEEASPWIFWNIRDLRTFKEDLEIFTGKTKVEKKGVNHNALDDARSQAQFVIEGWKVMNQAAKALKGAK